MCFAEGRQAAAKEGLGRHWHTALKEETEVGMGIPGRGQRE